jgi:DNA-binding SARP family transcriptional activator
VRFEALVAEGRAVMSADAAAAARSFEQALGLWRGTALGDLADQVSLQPEIARLEELRLAALEDRITAELELGRNRELVPELETLVGAHPFRERLWLHLMTALYRSERQADALAAFHRARDLLAEILAFARVIRCPIAVSCTRKARAISDTVRPPTMRSVSATRVSSASAG